MNDNHDLRRQSGKGNDIDITIHLKMKKLNTCNKKHWIAGGFINDGLCYWFYVSAAQRLVLCR